ncbi:guanylate cyclase 32E [Elysia marginata]|uniref:Guanylate cyclase 32E n=1 Tax=Elysia marginata TaxID=1093978 RepID=A0AAV4JA15_9GAST|nr:guanylate cyclase 32E [Elysia marginata]
MNALSYIMFPADGMCRGEPLSDRGKRLKMVKILSVTLLPILTLWAFTVYSLSDSIQGKVDIEQTQYAVKFSVEIGMFLDRLQRERDMSVLYLSILGPETKTFLMNEYLLTDQALDHLSDWPVRSDTSNIFQSKKTFKQFLKEHRQQLDPSNYDIYVEMDFYSFLIERFIEWMYGAIKESNMASIWKILVAYQKIVTVMEHIGIERALGTVFYVEAGFPERVYELYNSRVNIFKANYRSAVLYSDAVDPIYQGGVTSTGTNLTAVIESFRFEIQHVMQTEASITKGQWWFDNMTLYLDTLLIIQQELADLINGQLEEIIQTEEQNLTISACFLVIVFLMCPVVLFSVQTLTSDIQRYALALVHNTKQLSREKKHVRELLYQMVPPGIEELLAHRRPVNAEYYKAVTIMFYDMRGLNRVSAKMTATDVIDLLNWMYTQMDTHIQAHDVYKVEAINDSCMLVSGAPKRIGNRHTGEIANLALELLHLVNTQAWTGSNNVGNVKVQLRIGISTGPCIAGVVGVNIPRYCVFGDTINVASRMKSYGLPNKIQMHASTYMSLKKRGDYIVSLRGPIETKGKGPLTAYWLLGKKRSENYPKHALDHQFTLPIPRENEETGDASREDKSDVTDGEASDELLPCNHGKFGTFEITRAVHSQMSWTSMAERECSQAQLHIKNSEDESVKVRSISDEIPHRHLWSLVRSTAEKAAEGGAERHPQLAGGSKVTDDSVDVGEARESLNHGGAAELGVIGPESVGGSGERETGEMEEGAVGGEVDEMMYACVGVAVTAMEREGQEDLLHACMAQAEYDKKGALQD